MPEFESVFWEATRTKILPAPELIDGAVGVEERIGWMVIINGNLMDLIAHFLNDFGVGSKLSSADATRTGFPVFH